MDVCDREAEGDVRVEAASQAERGAASCAGGPCDGAVDGFAVAAAAAGEAKGQPAMWVDLLVHFSKGATNIKGHFADAGTKVMEQQQVGLS
jgi:hypothetical protein